MGNVLNHNFGGSMQNPQIQQVRQLMNAFRNSANPQQMLAQMAQNNPQFSQVMQLCQNGNPKDVFYALCKEKGVDPNTILNQLR